MQAATDAPPLVAQFDQDNTLSAMRTAEMQAARVSFNVLVGEVISAISRGCKHSGSFKQSVQVELVDDYLSFVDPTDATVCLDTISGKARSCVFTSLQQFRGDFERILANAMVRYLNGLLGLSS
jgi:hypothetical protein